MFERYTEHARRAIFFARYEASNFGSPFIDTEHLLLGIMKEDRTVQSALAATSEQLRQEIEATIARGNPISTSVDLPLSTTAKRALGYGAEESSLLHHKTIDSGHLLLGILRVETCPASEILRRHGIDVAGYRAIISRTARPLIPELPEKPAPANSQLGSLIFSLDQLVERTANEIHRDEGFAAQRLKRKPWSRKEAIGHLIEWATIHHGWFARALAEPRLDAPGYPQDDWVAAQGYDDIHWNELLNLWAAINRLLVHVLTRIPEAKLNMPCRIGIAKPIPLLQLVQDYCEHCEDIVAQIRSHL